MVYVLLVALTAVCATGWFASGAQYMRANIGRLMPKWSGLHIPTELESTFVDRIVRARRRLVSGIAAGGTASVVVLFVLQLENEFEHGIQIVFVTGCVVGAVGAQCATLLIESRRRASIDGDVVRERGTALRASVPLVVTIGAIMLSLASAALAALGIWLFATDAFEFDTREGPLSPIAAIVGTTALATSFPLYFALATATSRRRQAAINSTELALDDAFFARQLLTAVAIPLYILPTGALPILIGLTQGLRHPEFDQVRGNLLDAGIIAYIVAISYVVVAYLLKPQWHYLRTLWPDVAAQGAIERASLKQAKREAAARAYRGLPPLESATSVAERQPTANL